MKMLTKFRRFSLPLAESFDTWRIIPRLIILAYSYLVFSVYQWYKSIPTFPQHACDAATLKVLLDHGISIADAQLTACSITGLVGGPTNAQTALVSAVIGLSAAIFGLYTSTGRSWISGLPPDINGPHPTPSLSQVVSEHVKSTE